MRPPDVHLVATHDRAPPPFGMTADSDAGELRALRARADGGPAGGGAAGRESAIYGRRFSAAENAARAATWEALCRSFFQRFVAESATVVDLGAGDGHFLRNIRAARRIAVDVGEQVQELEREGIEVLQVDATELASHLRGVADVVFASNFLEHLPDKKTLLEVLAQVHRALRPGGRLIVLQPNIRYVGAAYWDYVDHHIALTEHSLVEALEVCGFELERLIPRFLPYTVKSRLGRFAPLTGLYLKLPLLWRLFGRQTLAIARAAPTAEGR